MTMSSGSATVYPVHLQVEGDDRLMIEWSDGVRHVLTWATLRANCPCAGCRAERDKPAPLLPVIRAEEAQPARPRSMEPVGRYGYQIAWTDGHSSGIFTFEHLRALGSKETPAP